jgi:uncharacterized protein YutE (UPF0331/DUF86 family)
MRYNGVVQRKLALLEQQVQRLGASMESVLLDDFKDNWEKRCVVERALQVSVEIMIDVAERIIALEGAGPVATAVEAIETLVRLKVLDSSVPYVDMVRFRNMVVHQYEEIDSALLYELSKNRLGDFRKFRDEIDRLD